MGSMVNDYGVRCHEYNPRVYREMNLHQSTSAIRHAVMLPSSVNVWASGLATATKPFVAIDNSSHMSTAL